MQGHFDLTMLHTPGLTKELLEAVRKVGGDPAVEKFLRRFPIDGEWRTDNIIVQSAPSYLYYRAMSGPSIYGFTNGSGTWTAFGGIYLATTSTEPSYTGDVYTQDTNSSTLVDTPSGIASNTAVKKFIDECIVTPDFKSDAGGREAIYAKFKWLYLPGECTSDQIRSLIVVGTPSFTEWNYNSRSKTRMARVRIKDSGGNPVTLNKIATKSLLVEYTLTLPSV